MKPHRLLALAFVFAAGTGSAEIEVPKVTLDWQSSAANATELSVEIEQLYLALYNSGNLTVRQIDIGNPPYVESLLRSEGVMHGAYFPVALDAMMCDLNRQYCSRDLQPAAVQALSDPKAHVGGYEASRGQWRLSGGETLTIPDYAFTTITTLVRVPATRGIRVENFAAEPEMDCSAWRMSCEEVVRSFNPPTLKAPSATVPVTLPRVQIGASVSLRQDEASVIFQKLEDVRGDRAPPLAAPKAFDEGEAFSSEWSESLTRQSPADLTLDTIKRNLRPIGEIKPYGIGDEPFVGDQLALFKLINHPFARLEELDSKHMRPVNVVVIDTRMSAGHCDLPVMRTPGGTDLVPPALLSVELEPLGETIPTPVADTPGDHDDATGHDGGLSGCETIDQLAMSDADHAAGVAGVIASRENGKGMVGMNPYAHLWMMAFDRNQVADQQIASLIRQMQIDIPPEVRVANLSFGVRPLLANPRDMETAMAILGSRLLVVAAAGNDGLEMSSENCPILPACLNGLDNVLTVVGLDSDLENPGLWQTQSASSNSSPAFEIGAPAENVLTTVTDNRFALQAGTSFAAPQVTAAASLIFAAGEFVYGDDLAGGQLSPKIVKDRLVYTSDFFAGLSGVVNAGRLNVGRAINVRDAQFELFDGRRVVGQVIEAPDQFVCRTPIEAQQFQKWYNVRRLSWNDAKQRHILFRNQGVDLGGRYGELERDSSCLIRTLSAPIEVLTREAGGASEIVQFEFRDIRDYTSPLFDE